MCLKYGYAVSRARDYTIRYFSMSVGWISNKQQTNISLSFFLIRCMYS